MTRILGIIGASYSGTTVMTGLLGSLPGIFPAGEVHWLCRYDAPGIPCETCGWNCPQWPPEFVERYRASRDRRAALRSHFSRYEWVVVSDKDPAIYRETGSVDHWILQWRDPRGWCVAARHHDGETIERAIEAWTSLYNDALALLRNQPNVSYVDWDIYAQNPAFHLRVLAAELGIQIPTGFSFSPNFAHMIGGNRDVTSATPSARHCDYFAGAIRRDERWQWELSKEENQQVINHPEVARLVDKLSSKFFVDRQSPPPTASLPTALCPGVLTQNLRSIALSREGFDDYARHPLVGLFNIRAVSGGPSLKLFTNNDCVITRRLALLGEGGFERLAMLRWTQLTEGCLTVLDVGAFTGIYALQAAAAHPELRVIAFEPNYLAYVRLLTNIKLNSLEMRIAPVLAALSDWEGIMPLRHPFGVYTLASGESFVPEFIPNPAFTTDVQTFRLDDLMAKQERLAALLPIPIEHDRSPFAVKIDVEGFETLVLAGMRQFIATRRPRILLEILDAATFAGVRTALAEYRLYFLDEESGRVVLSDRQFARFGNYVALHQSDGEGLDRLSGPTQV